MSQYLERAAELLKQATAANEKEHEKMPITLHQNRLEIDRAYATLAAIDKGLLPQHLADDIYGRFATNSR